MSNYSDSNFKSLTARLGSWSISLSSLQTVVLLGLITGTMFCAFIFGLMSGKKIGFDTALEATLASVGKLPLSEPEETKNLSPEVVSSIYANLDQSNNPLDLKIKDKTDAVDNSNKVIADTNQKQTMEGAANKLDQEINQLVVKSEAATKPEKLDEQVSSIRAAMNLESKKEKDSKSAEAQKTEIVEQATTKVNTNNQTIVVNDLPEVSKEPSIPEPILVQEPAALEVLPPAKVALANTKKSQPGWYVQVATPNSAEEAQSLAGKLKSNGFPASVETFTAGTRTYYRVLVGKEDNKTQGEMLLSQLQRETYIKSKPFLKMVR